ncbi:unnamed protein product [Citrullus colocynthis]|uniref:Uncharacterized protein n=1 Tax=Citrullus colocynthis TaxID=252529 RepID=A0ABP0YZC1_9ROSI
MGIPKGQFATELLPQSTRPQHNHNFSENFLVRHLEERIVGKPRSELQGDKLKEKVTRVQKLGGTARCHQANNFDNVVHGLRERLLQDSQAWDLEIKPEVIQIDNRKKDDSKSSERSN